MDFVNIPNSRKEEILYKKILLNDYELLYELASKKKAVICFYDDGQGVSKRRIMDTLKSSFAFSRSWIGLKKTEHSQKEAFVAYCKKRNLTFLNPQA